MSQRTRRVILSVAAIAIAMSACGCDRSEALVEDLATQAVTNRTGAAVAMSDAVRNDEVGWGRLLDMAFERLDAGDTQGPAIAGAVLDMTAQTIDTQPTGPEFEIKWIRVGRLAMFSAKAAVEAGDLELARSLVLAGPDRWQRESYWRRYPDHDGLAALILAVTGDRQEALRRLSSRAVLQGDAKLAYDEIRRMRP